MIMAVGRRIRKDRRDDEYAHTRHGGETGIPARSAARLCTSPYTYLERVRVSSLTKLFQAKIQLRRLFDRILKI